MSWKAANAAGAKQAAIRAAQEARAKESNPRKSFGGKCSMSHCGSPATTRRGRKNFCREHGEDL